MFHLIYLQCGTDFNHRFADDDAGMGCMVRREREASPKNDTNVLFV